MAQWWWRVYTERSSLWNIILTQRYGNEFSINLSTMLNRNDCSPIVRSFTSLAQSQSSFVLLNQNCFKWQLKSGSSILFWEEHWQEIGRLKSLFPRLYRISNLKFCSVSQFMHHWRGHSSNSKLLWSRPLVERDVAWFQNLSNILSAVTLGHGQDIIYWSPGKRSFSSKVFGQCQSMRTSHQIGTRKIWNKIWSSKFPPKIAIFLWKTQWGVLPTKLFINKRIFSVSPFVCGVIVMRKSTDHLFCTCSLAKMAWNFVGQWWDLEFKMASINSFSLSAYFKLIHNGVYGNV